MAKEDEILQELKKIREALEKAPPPAPPKGFWNEFKAFLSQYKILGLAIAFIIGIYLGSLVQSLVKDLLVPLIGIPLGMLGLENLADATAGPIQNQIFAYGDFIVQLITFLIVILIVFIIVKVAKRMKIE